MYNDHLRLIVKHVVYFLLVLIELFLLSVTSNRRFRSSKAKF